MCSWWRVVHIKYNIAPCVTGLTKLTASRKHISNMARIAVCRHISFTSGAGDKGFYCGQNTQYILTGSSCLLENNSKLLHTSCVLKYKKNKPENNISINKHEKVIPTIPDIHVFGAEGEDMGIMPKRKAENLAREEDMKLVLVGTDDDTGIANYKIMTGKQLAEESKRMKQEKKADKKKETKIIRVSSKITAHDLENKINHASSLLEKNHPIRISIKQASGGAEKEFSRIFEQFTKSCSAVGQVQKAQHTKHELVVMIRPLSEFSEHAESTHAKLKPMTLSELKDTTDKKDA